MRADSAAADKVVGGAGEGRAGAGAGGRACARGTATGGAKEMHARPVVAVGRVASTHSVQAGVKCQCVRASCFMWNHFPVALEPFQILNFSGQFGCVCGGFSPGQIAVKPFFGADFSEEEVLLRVLKQTPKHKSCIWT